MVTQPLDFSRSVSNNENFDIMNTVENVTSSVIDKEHNYTNIPTVIPKVALPRETRPETLANAPTASPIKTSTNDRTSLTSGVIGKEHNYTNIPTDTPKAVLPRENRLETLTNASTASPIKTSTNDITSLNDVIELPNITPETHDSTTIHDRNYSCCNILLSHNVGHALTEIPFQLARCTGQYVYIPYYPDRSFLHQIHYFINLFEMMNVTQGECFEYYTQHPDKHPKYDFIHAYAQTAFAKNTTYPDAYEVGRNLRRAQKLLLSSCGIPPPTFYHDIPENAHLLQNDDINGRSYEHVSNRNPSRSIVVLVRRGNRILKNFHEITPICNELNVKCEIINLDKYWSKTETKDFCFVLKTFQDKLVIAMQGAEIIYPLYVGTRQLLVTFKKEKTDRRHYGKPKIEIGEEEFVPNLVLEKRNGGLDPFFPEFGLHFGSEITILHGTLVNPYEDEDPNRVAAIRASSHTCTPKRFFADRIVPDIKEFCLDMTVDVDELRSMLQERIVGGELLQVGQLTSERF